tara:strand:+ start:40 stop:240 length:201 start_codon:yes stop_codon:yes gene_type:complete
MRYFVTILVFVLIPTFAFAQQENDKCLKASAFNLKCNIIGKSFSKLKNFSENNQTINDTVENIRKK